MNDNILIIIGSPKNEKSTSDIISKNLEKKLDMEKLNYSKIYLSKELKNQDTLMKKISHADTLVFVFPIYENSVPSNLLKFFENTYTNKEKLSDSNKKMFVITNSGYADIKASKTAITTCSIFAKQMNFKWLGGIAAAPGTLISGEDLGKMYKNFSKSLKLLVKSLCSDSKELSHEIFALNEKNVIPPILYRFAGLFYKNTIIKKIGKNAFYAKPFYT